MLTPTRLCGPLAGLAASLFVVGCSCSDDETALGGGGSTTTTTTTGGFGGAGGAGGGGGGGGTGGVGGAITCDPGVGTTFALTMLNFGEGMSGEWKSIGQNIDGLVSDETSTDVCQPNSGATPDFAYPDGDNGIDNSFGRSLVPLILTLVPSWGVSVNQYLDTGYFNAMVKIYCLPPTGNAVLLSKVFAGTDLGMTPLYDGTDKWPVAPEILSDPMDPESSTLIFENSTVNGSTYDSGKQETFVLVIPIDFSGDTTLLKLTLHSAQLVMTLSDDRKSATGGVLSGVLNTEEVIDQMRKVGYIAGVCNDASFQGALDYIRRSSDIMADGTQDPTMTCDGISFGVAFDMSEVQIGDVGPASPPGMVCP